MKQERSPPSFERQVRSSRLPLAPKVISPGKNPTRATIPSVPRYSEVNLDIMQQLTLLSRVLLHYGYCSFALVLPYAAGGTLGNAITSRKNNPSWRHTKLWGHAIRG
jgi:hypothetical protein